MIVIRSPLRAFRWYRSRVLRKRRARERLPRREQKLLATLARMVGQYTLALMALIWVGLNIGAPELSPVRDHIVDLRIGSISRYLFWYLFWVLPVGGGISAVTILAATYKEVRLGLKLRRQLASTRARWKARHVHTHPITKKDPLPF